MNFEEACLILELPNTFNSQQLKHNYYSLALKYHPDKNYEVDATSKFQTIQSAYNYLNQANQANQANEESDTNYSDLVKIILDSILNKKIYNENS